jgi:hypothetical protein|nr:MAG TPA: hypothetical protein [Bacteriophage sp.]
MAKKSMCGLYNKSVQFSDKNKMVHRTELIPVNGTMYQIGAYQYFTHWEDGKLAVSEASSGFRVLTYKRIGGETDTQLIKRALEKMKEVNPSLADWEKVKSIMKKEGIPYPANKWVSNLKDIKSNEESKKD